jgi:hypothetical protein
VAEVDSCSVCGRTILAGERTRAYLTPDRERRHVCELCRERAEGLGWVWEELVDDEPVEEPRRRRRGAGLVALLRSREKGEPAVAGEGAEREDGGEEPLAGPPAPDPADRGADVGHIQPPPAESAASPAERALERFNASEESRTVAGLTRTLGLPWVSVGSAAGSPGEVRITVAWELSWYQWGVDLKDETRPVYQIDKGYELDQLDGPARHWNAHASGDGRLELGPTGVG